MKEPTSIKQDNTNVVAIAAGIVTALVVLGGFWIGGYDFNERGPTAVGMYILTIYAGCAGYFLTKMGAGK